MHSFEILVDPRGDELPHRRVREHAVEGVIVFLVSGAISIAVAVALTFLAHVLG
jgi:hypothetical protein